jgi:flagellar biosynthesis protein FlhF
MHNLERAAMPELTSGPTSAFSAPALGVAMPHGPSEDIAFLAAALEAHHVPLLLADRLLASAPELLSRDAVVDRLAAALSNEIAFTPPSEVLHAWRLLLIGPPGAGKTTIAAKIAARLGAADTLLINADPDRAVAQLEEYADVLGVPLAIAGDTGALRAIVADARNRRIVIDTKGVAPNDAAGCAALAELIAATAATPLLVMSADSAAEEAAAMARCFAALGARALLPTRLDLVRRLGGVLAAADAGRLALCAAGITPQFAYGLRPLTPLLLARCLLSGTPAERPPRVLVTSSN